MITKLAEAQVETRYGLFTESMIQVSGADAICLHLGELRGKKRVPVRVHSQCLTAHVFNGIECDCAIQASYAQGLIAAQGAGLLIWLDHEGKGNGHLAKMLSVKYKRQGYSQETAYQMAGYPPDNRDYAIAAQVIESFGIGSVMLITNNPRKVDALSDLGIEIEGVIHTPAVRDPSWEQRLNGRTSESTRGQDPR